VLTAGHPAGDTIVEAVRPSNKVTMGLLRVGREGIRIGQIQTRSFLNDLEIDRTSSGRGDVEGFRSLGEVNIPATFIPGMQFKFARNQFTPP
jgi:hypothetical protein